MEERLRRWEEASKPVQGAELCSLQLEFEHLKAKWKRLHKGLTLQAKFHAMGSGPAPSESALNQLDDLRGEMEQVLGRIRELESKNRSEQDERRRTAKKVLARLKR